MTHCGHDHHHHSTGDGKRLLAAFAVIAAFMVVEAIGGVLSGSLALLADATHMFTDAFALALAASAQWIAMRPADKRLHFGYRRTQVLAAFVNGVVLTVLLAWIVFEALKRFFFTPVVIDWSLMLNIAIIGLLANGIAFFILHRSATDNVNIRGAMLHVVSDLVGSVAAIIGAVIIAVTGWAKIDPILSIIVAGLIGRSAWRLLYDTGLILMEGAPKDINVDKLVSDLHEAAPDVLDIHQMRIWQLTPGEPRLTMHAKINSSAAAQKSLKNMKLLLDEKYGIRKSTVQLEIGDDCPDCNPVDTYQTHLQAHKKTIDEGTAPYAKKASPQPAATCK